MRRLCFFGIIFSMQAIVAQGGSALGQTCTASSRVVEFSGKLCIRGNCQIIQHKVRFLGTNILLYPNISKDEGTAFELGRSVEMKDATLNWRASGPSGSTEFSTASAERRGGQYMLVMNHNWSESGKIIAQGWRKIGIEFPTCTSCEVSVYDFGFDYERGPGFRATFDKYSCRISE
jgi:hypothetical protein